VSKPTVYLAGPYTNPDPVANTRAAILLGARLRDKYKCRVFVPHFSLFEHMLAPQPYERWLEIDLDWLPHCDVLYRMPGGSSGSDAEVAAARKAGIPVVFDEESFASWRVIYDQDSGK
jgi:hypothetical protein